MAMRHPTNKKSPAQLQREIDAVLVRPLVQSPYSVHSPEWERDRLVGKLSREKARLARGTSSSSKSAPKRSHATTKADDVRETRLPGAGAKDTKKAVSAKKVFNSKVEKMLERAGATLKFEMKGEPFDHREFLLETKAGTAHVIPLGNWVAVRFEDPEAAAKLVGTSGLNTYSGKWNRNYFAWPANEALADVTRWLERIVA